MNARDAKPGMLVVDQDGHRWILLDRAPAYNANPDRATPHTHVTPELLRPRWHVPGAKVQAEYGPGGVAWWVQDPQTGAIGERVYIKEVEQVD